MKTLLSAIHEAQKNHSALGHFNVSELSALKAILNAAKALGVPVIIGVSEGERKFIGTRTIAAVIHSLREELNHPIYLNADHTKSLQGAKEALEAGFDAVLFDGSALEFEENMRQTKEVADYVKSKNPDVLVEGELGYIGTSSKLLDEVPEGAALDKKALPTPEQAKEFVENTLVDLFSPAVGNFHGMLKDRSNPSLDIERVKEIKKAVDVPLVLHGGSGLKDEDFTKAIQAGISVVHINTEIRKAWRESLEKALQDNPDEVAPYHLLDPAVSGMEELVLRRLKLFG